MSYSIKECQGEFISRVHEAEKQGDYMSLFMLAKQAQDDEQHAAVVSMAIKAQNQVAQEETYRGQVDERDEYERECHFAPAEGF